MHSEKKTMGGDPVVCCKCSFWLNDNDFRKSDGYFYCPKCYKRTFAKMQTKKAA